MTATWQPAPTPVGNPYLEWIRGPGEPFTPWARRGRTPSGWLTLTGNPPALGYSATQPPAGTEAYPMFLPSAPAAGMNPTVFGPNPWPGGAPVPTCIVAVIDDGINVSLDRFTANGQTRVDYAWIQDAAPVAGSAVPFGRELTATDIDNARTTAPTREAAMRQLGLDAGGNFKESTLATRASHGTHVMDIASGFRAGDPNLQQAPNIRLITVQLPFYVSQDTSGTSFAPFVAAALDYVTERATAMATAAGTTLPLYINFSYALGAGPHDGTGRVEQVFDSRLNAMPQNLTATLILPAGNRLQARGYAALPDAARVGAGGKTGVAWRVFPGDTTPNFVEIWTADPAATVTVTTPSGAAATVTSGQAENLELSGNVLASLTMQTHNGKGMAVLAARPTDTGKAPNGPWTPCPFGDWRIEVSGSTAEAWVQCDTAPYQRLNGAIQACLHDPDDQKYDTDGRPRQTDAPGSLVRRDNTISGMATLARTDVIVVGACVSTTGAKAPYSSAGTTRRPDIDAPAERGLARRGLVAASTWGGTGVAMAGTSVAAPLVTRDYSKGLTPLQGAAGTSDRPDAWK